MKNQSTPPENAPAKAYEAPKLENKKRYKLIACEIIYREACLLAAQSSNIIDVQFLRKGLHDAGKEIMRSQIQDAINQIEKESYDAILLGYARCNDGVVGLTTTHTPLVIPRAHDCITFFFGSTQLYNNYFNQFPGTYFRTSGWTERDESDGDSVMDQLGLNNTYSEYVEKYGEENAQFIMQSLGQWTDNYEYLTYINMSLPIDTEYAQLAQKEAQKRQLQFKHVKGSLNLLQNLLDGNWPEEHFLIVPPQKTIQPDNDGKILTLNE